MIEDKML